MPKMKTNRGAAKRFKVTGTGKIRFNKSKRRHILTKKGTSWKRHARAGDNLCDADAKQVRVLIPYK
jgi:large subunit ribosomal protein L35